jgi:hypothetical protein
MIQKKLEIELIQIIQIEMGNVEPNIIIINFGLHTQLK